MLERVLDAVIGQTKLRMDVNTHGGAVSDASASDASASGAGSSAASTVDANEPVLINAEALDRLRELESGQSGLPFFETNRQTELALQSVRENPTRLSGLLERVQKMLQDSSAKRIGLLVNGEDAFGTISSGDEHSASTEYLMSPRVAYCIRMKNEAFAAIRAAYDSFEREYRTVSGGAPPPLAYDLMEGDASDMLSNDFAKLVALTLASSRMHSSTEAAYLSMSAAKMNTLQLRQQLRATVRTALDVYGGGGGGSGRYGDVGGNQSSMASSRKRPLQPYDVIDTLYEQASALAQALPIGPTYFGQSGPVHGLHHKVQYTYDQLQRVRQYNSGRRNPF